MIIGLLHLHGSPALQELVKNTFTRSGLLAATDRIYYSGVALPHPTSARVQNESALYACAQQYPHAYVWSFNTKEFNRGTAADLDWCAYELFFLIEHWQRALLTLEAGYDAYGVNLHTVPEPHFAAYCFWMTGEAMKRSTLLHPYCAYQSFTNHYSHRYPTTEYSDCDWEQAAPLSSRSLQRKVLQLPPTSLPLASLLLLLFQAKNHYHPVPGHPTLRPKIIIDAGNDPGVLAVAAPGIGRVEVVTRPETEHLVTFYPSLGWNTELTTWQSSSGPADLIYTVPERVSSWLPQLAGMGVLVVAGLVTSSYPYQHIGNYTLIALNSKDLP